MSLHGDEKHTNHTRLTSLYWMWFLASRNAAGPCIVTEHFDRCYFQQTIGGKELRVNP